MQRTNRPQRHSVASFPFIVTPETSEVINKPSFLELLNPKREDVACKGQTAKLHERAGGNKSPESSRRISLSYKPYLEAGGAGETPARRYSTSSISSRLFYSRNEKPVQDDNEYKSSTQSLTTEDNSFNAKGSKILEDSNKLPKIVLTAPDQKPEKNKKKRKKKKVEKELKSTEIDLNEDIGVEMSLDKDDAVVVPEIPTVPSSINSNDNSDEDDSKDWKYKLESQYFQLGWDTTKAFTYSYFPKLKKERKNGKERKNMKIEKKAASTHFHVQTS